MGGPSAAGPHRCGCRAARSGRTGPVVGGTARLGAQQCHCGVRRVLPVGAKVGRAGSRNRNRAGLTAWSRLLEGGGVQRPAEPARVLAAMLRAPAGKGVLPLPGTAASPSPPPVLVAWLLARIAEAKAPVALGPVPHHPGDTPRPASGACDAVGHSGISRRSEERRVG